MRGAFMGDKGAQSELGQLLMSGLRVGGTEVIAPDLLAADVWFRLTAGDTIFDNNRLRTSVENRLTSDEINEARRRAAAFKLLSFEEVMHLQIDLPAPAATSATR